MQLDGFEVLREVALEVNGRNLYKGPESVFDWHHHQKDSSERTLALQINRSVRISSGKQDSYLTVADFRSVDRKSLEDSQQVGLTKTAA